MSDELQEKIQNATGEFIKGFLTGQVVLGVLLFFLLKVFLLRNSTETRQELRKGRKPFQAAKVRLSI